MRENLIERRASEYDDSAPKNDASAPLYRVLRCAQHAMNRCLEARKEGSSHIFDAQAYERDHRSEERDYDEHA